MDVLVFPGVSGFLFRVILFFQKLFTQQPALVLCNSLVGPTALLTQWRSRSGDEWRKLLTDSVADMKGCSRANWPGCHSRVLNLALGVP